MTRGHATVQNPCFPRTSVNSFGLINCLLTDLENNDGSAGPSSFA